MRVVPPVAPRAKSIEMVAEGECSWRAEKLLLFTQIIITNLKQHLLAVTLDYEFLLKLRRGRLPYAQVSV